MDPCDDVTDDDIRTAIQNASGARNPLFVPEVIIMMMTYGVLHLIPLSKIFKPMAGFCTCMLIRIVFGFFSGAI